MRALIVAKSFPPLNSAQALQMGKVAEAITAAGIDTRILAGVGVNANHSEFSQRNCSVVYVPYYRSHSKIPVVATVLNCFRGELDCLGHLSTWVRRATARARRLIDTFAPDCLLTCSMPFQSHVVGLAIRRLTGLPWVASFSDPWPGCLAPSPYYSKGLPIIREASVALLGKVVCECDAIHMPSRYAVEWSEQVSGFSLTSKAVTIPHIGCSAPTMDVLSDCVGWLAHVGYLSRERASQALLVGVQKAHSEIPNYFKGLLCVGKVSSEFRQMVHRAGMEGIVKLTGQLSVERAMQISCSATALIVIEADMAVSPYLPSKFADYAVIGKPIVAVTPPASAIRDYLRSYGGGRAVRHDPDEIAEVLIELFSPDTEGHATFDSCRCPMAEVFSSKIVGNQYRALFSQITGGRKHQDNRRL